MVNMKKIGSLMVKPNTGIFKKTGKALIDNVRFPSMFPTKQRIHPRKNMTQKEYLRRTSGNITGRFTDTDGDMVINGMDCFGFNRKRHDDDEISYNLSYEVESDEDEEKVYTSAPLPEEVVRDQTEKEVDELLEKTSNTYNNLEEETGMESDYVEKEKEKKLKSTTYYDEEPEGAIGKLKEFAKEKMYEKKSNIKRGISRGLGYAFESSTARKMYKQQDLKDELESAKQRAIEAGVDKKRVEILQGYAKNSEAKIKALSKESKEREKQKKYADDIRFYTSLKAKAQSREAVMKSRQAKAKAYPQQSNMLDFSFVSGATQFRKKPEPQKQGMWWL